MAQLQTAVLLVLVAVLLSSLASMGAIFTARAARQGWPITIVWASATFAVTLPLIFDVFDRLGLG